MLAGERVLVTWPRHVADTTYFVNLFPSLQLNVTHDCAWWMRMLPLGVDKTKVTQGFLFPKETVASGSFEAEAALRPDAKGKSKSPSTRARARDEAKAAEALVAVAEPREEEAAPEARAARLLSCS